MKIVFKLIYIFIIFLNNILRTHRNLAYWFQTLMEIHINLNGQNIFKKNISIDGFILPKFIIYHTTSVYASLNFSDQKNVELIWELKYRPKGRKIKCQNIPILQTFTYCLWEWKMVQPLGETIWHYFLNFFPPLNIYTWNSTEYYPRGHKIYVHKTHVHEYSQ